MIGVSRGASNSQLVMVANRPAGNLSGSSPLNRWLECCPLSRYSLPLARSTPLCHSTPKKVPCSRCIPRKCSRAGLSGRSPSTGVMTANSEASSWVNGTLSTLILAIIFFLFRVFVRPRLRVVCNSAGYGLRELVKLVLDPIQQFSLLATHHLLGLPTFLHSLVVILLSLLRDHHAQIASPCAQRPTV